jgi:DNA-binding response OmpR family regulator
MEILVVDDNKDICLLIENILLSEGFEVESCCNPADFEKKFATGNPQLIITDLLMSGFDGRTLTKEVKSDPKNKDLKIMMMSAHPDAAKICQDIGADDFLAKPFEIDDLVNKIKALLH